MKNQALFFSKDKSKISKCRLLQFLVGALRVKFCFTPSLSTVSRENMSEQLQTFKTQISLRTMQSDQSRLCLQKQFIVLDGSMLELGISR